MDAALVESAFHFVDGRRVLRVPLVAVTLPPTVPARAGLHPVTRAVMAHDDETLRVECVDQAMAMPLARVAIYATYLTLGWDLAMYAYAIERAGMAMADGMTMREADLHAIARARLAFAVPRVCGACRAYTQLNAAARFGVCITHRRSVQPRGEAPDCWVAGVTDAEREAAARMA